jgi:hypothetical protein
MSKTNDKYLCLENPSQAMAWLRAFKAKMRVGDKKDSKEDNKLDITDSFLACAGCDAIEKLPTF